MIQLGGVPMKHVPLALTIDDVLLVPQFSTVLPKSVTEKADFLPNIHLNIPCLLYTSDAAD